MGENIDSVNGTTTQLGLDLDAAKKVISLYVTQTDKNTKTITKIQVKVGNIEQTVGQAATKEELKKNKETLDGAIAKSLEDAKDYALNEVGAGIRKDYDDAVTTVIQKKDSWNVASGMFDTNGNLTKAGITSITPTITTIFNTSFNKEWGAIKSGYVSTDKFAELQSTVEGHTSEIGTRITKDDAKGLIAEAFIQADKIVLTGHTMAFTGDQITIDTSNFKLDGSGNVSMKGEINATSGSIAGFNINKNSIGSIGQTEGMSLSNEYLQFMDQAYLHGEGYFVTCGNFMGTGLRINSVTSASNDLSTGIWILIDAGTSASSDKMCTALDLCTRWADQAGSFDSTNAYEGNHAIVIRGGDVIGLRPSYVRITANYSLTEYNHTIECSNNNEITLYLPSSPRLGQCYTIIQRGGKVVLSSGSKINILNIREGSLSGTWNSDTKGQVSWFWYNGGQWIVTYSTR